MGKEKSEEVIKLEEELNALIEKIKEDQRSKADKSLSEVCGNASDVPSIGLKCRRLLKGHINKVNSVHFSGDSRFLVSGALDSKLIIWDTWTGNKVQIIPIMSSWTMACCFAPSGNLVASGGMDNACTIYDINNKDAGGSAKIKRELVGFEGFLSSCRFLDDNRILTGSADMKIILWDLENNSRISEFHGHSGDVLSLSLNSDLSTFLTGSVDKTAKFHNSGFAFGTASEDKTTRLFDIRGDQEIGKYLPPNANSGFSCCALSLSGRYIVSGSDDSCVHSWDTLKGQHCGTLSGHSSRVTSLCLTSNGMAIATGSWDTSVRVWV